MFEYQSAIVREKGPRSRRREADVSGMRMTDLYTQYEEAYLILTHPLYTEEQVLNLFNLASYLNARLSDKTVIEWLKSLGNKGLPTTTNKPSLEVTYAHYRDAWQAGYDIKPVNTYFHYDVDVERPDLLDLRLTKEGVDYKQMFDECLVTVNGLFHRTNYVGDGLHVVEGARNGFHANDNHVGILHLGKLGKISTVPIRVSHVYKGGEKQPLGEVAYIKVYERAGHLTDKSILVCIGGYLHLPEGLIHRAGDGLYKIDFKDYPLAQRFYDSKDTIDLKRITRHFSKSTVNPDQVAVQELYSDEAITELLALSQSFFVIVDTPEIFQERTSVEPTDLPGRYVCYQKPNYPLVAGAGKCYEYWYRKELDRYVLSISGGMVNHYLFETTQWKDDLSIDNSRLPSNVMDFSRAQFWKLGKNLD